MTTFLHPFFDIEVEPMDTMGTAWLVKILSVDGRRFTYQLNGPFDQSAIDYMKSLLDAACFGDLVITPGAEGHDAQESPMRLKKHS
jgi:hypothetical protein